ncbi:B12-binding domain-containing radical SAM protein [Elusimicrobiota bacterium]
MKVLFLLKNSGMHERMGIMTLSSILKQQGHSVQLLLTEQSSEEDIVAKVKAYAPQVLAYSIMTGEHHYHIDLNSMVRRHHDALSVFGGPHPTFTPEIVEKDDVDAVCVGEGDICFPELLKRMEDGRDFFDVPSFWFKKPNGDIIRNEMGNLVENLDDLPHPDRKLMYDVETVLGLKGMKLFMAMRGCPYQCSYCFNHAYNKMTKGKGKVIRTRSVDSMISEIKEVKEKYFLDRVWIDDDTFLVKPEGWLEEFAERFPKEIGIPLFVNVRANLLTQDRIGELLQRMNCRNVCLGVECGNNKAATEILQRNLTNDRIIKACEILHKYNIRIQTQNLIGLPIDNALEVDLETLDLNIKLRPHFGQTSILYPYPKTKIGQLAVEKGMFDADFEKIRVSNKTGSPLDFGDPKLKRKIVNLHQLFGIIVQFPFLRPITPFLISLPLTRFYNWLFFAFYGYKYSTISSMRGFLKMIPHYMSFYFRYVSGLENRTVFKSVSQNQTYPQDSRE